MRGLRLVMGALGCEIFAHANVKRMNLKSEQIGFYPYLLAVLFFCQIYHP